MFKQTELMCNTQTGLNGEKLKNGKMLVHLVLLSFEVDALEGE